MHSEGVSHAVYGLVEAGIYEERVWNMLLDKVRSKKFDYLVVCNKPFDPTSFTRLTGSEHAFERFFTGFGKTLMYEDRINLYELNDSINTV